MRVFLLHGMGRTSASMWWLERHLAAAGHRASHFGYSVARHDLETIAQHFRQHVQTVLAEDRRALAGKVSSAQAAEHEAKLPYATIGHSLGNVIVRLASTELPPGLERMVMLAPPNHPATLARMLRHNPVYRLATQDAGQKLADGSFFRELPVPDLPILVIAGTGGPRSPWLPFGGEANDAVVRVAETQLEGVHHLAVAGLHTFLMNRSDVLGAVSTFLAGSIPAGAIGPEGVSEPS